MTETIKTDATIAPLNENVNTTNNTKHEKIKEKNKNSVKNNHENSELSKNPSEKLPKRDCSPKIIDYYLDNDQDGDRELYIKKNDNSYKFDRLFDRWMFYNGYNWEHDISFNCMIDGINKIISVFEKEAVHRKRKFDKCDKKSKKYGKLKSHYKHVKDRIDSLKKITRKKVIVELASMGDEGLNVKGDEWDKKLNLIAFENCVIDIETGEKKIKSDPLDYLSKSVKFKFNPKAKCPAWKKFLHEIFEGDPKKVKFLQRLLGYAFCGKGNEHINPIFCGEHGRNGKGTIMEILLYILVDYVDKLPSEFIMDSKYKKDAESPDAMLLKLIGKRIVFISETGKNRMLNIPKVKELSGGDTLTGRPPYGKRPITFKPTHTLFTITNRLPRITDDDNAFWQRTILILFNLSYVSNPVESWERKKDTDLEEKLKSEAEGIIKWILEGYQIYLKEGLNIPDSIKNATAEYRKNEDVTGMFIDEMCCIDSSTAREKYSEIKISYDKWCEDNGYHQLSTKNLGLYFKNKGFEKKPSNGEVYYYGIFLNQ